MQSKRRRACAVAGAVLAMGSWTFADHFSASWTFAGPGNWANGVNWSTNPNPPINNGDTYDATIAIPEAQVMLFDPVSVIDFTHSAGTFTGGGTLSVNGLMLWDGGTIIGSGAIIINDSLLITGPERIFGQRTINIAASAIVTWDSGLINAHDDVGGGGVVNNAGTWQDDSDDAYIWNSAQSPVFNNTGTLVKIGGNASPKVYDPVFNNQGFVDIQANGLHFTGGGLNTGSYSLAVDSLLAFSDYNQFYAGSGSPTTVFSSTAVIASLGEVSFRNQFGNANTAFGGKIDSTLISIDTDDAGQAPLNEGRVTFVSGALINTIDPLQGTLHMKSGTARFETGQDIGFGSAILDGGIIHTADVLAFGSITWNGGTIMGDEVLAESGITVSTGSLEFIGTDQKALQDVSFFNGIASHATISEGSVSLLRAQIINLASASFDFQGSAILENVGSSNDGTDFVIAPDALLVKSAGAGVAEFKDLLLLNDGQVSVDAGTLKLAGGSTHTGSVTIATGATLELAPGSHGVIHSFQPGATASGDFDSHLTVTGDTQFLNGSHLMVEKVHIDGADVTFEGGIFNVGRLSMDNGARAIVAADFNKTVRVGSIAIESFSESVLDLTNNKMIVAYGSEPPEDIAELIRQYIASGHNTGTWDGEKILTSLGDATQFALGYGDNHILGFDDFGDYAVDEDSVLIKFTYYGDANLDGTVNVADLVKLASNWKLSGLWTEGDFNYDGFVDKLDLGLMALNWHEGNITPLGPALAAWDWAI